MQKLLIRAFPNLGESLTSHIQRICQLNIITPHDFWRLISAEGAHYPQTDLSSLINIVPNSLINLNSLADMSDLALDSIEGLTFIPTLRKWYGSTADPKHMSSQRVLNNLIDHHIKFCPLCLKKHNYYKLIWQVKEVEVCLEHSVKLIRECASCGNRISCLAPNSIAGVCPCCGSNLQDMVCQETEITDFDNRVYEDWKYLTDPNKSSFVNPLLEDKRQQLALKVLFVASRQEKIFKRDIATDSILTDSSISMLLQTARGTNSTHRFIHLSIILDLLRHDHMSLEQFCKLNLPESFSRSILDPEPLLRNQYSCQAPWCEHYKTSGSLKRTTTSKRINMDGTAYNYYMFCESCGTQYAIDSNTRDLVERGYFISIGWNKVRELALEGNSIRNIAQKLEKPFDKILRCIVFLITNRILPKESYVLDIPNQPEPTIVNEFINKITAGVSIKTIKKQLGLAYSQFLYYWFLPEVQISYIKASIKQNQTPPDIDWSEDLNKAIEELTLKNEIITIKKVSKKLDLCPESLRLHGLLPTIKKAKKLQRDEIKMQKSIEYKKIVDELIKQSVNWGIPLTSSFIYEKLGINRTVLVRSYPEVTKYVSTAVKNIKET